MDESLLAKYPDLERTHFWWETRRRLLRALLAPYLVDSPRVLDIGCGSGVTAQMLANRGAKVVGVDLESPPTSFQGEHVTFLCGDFLALSKEVGEFDAVIALDAVEHFEDEPAVLEAVFANTRAGGVAVVTVPAYRWLWSSHDDANHHYRRYSRSRLGSALTLAGFKVERIGYVFAALVVPKAIVALVERRKAQGVEISNTPSDALNRLATTYFRAETELALRLNRFLPFGTSVVGVARKPQ